MYTSWVSRNLCSGPLGFSFVKGEIQEVFEARSWAELVDELCDVYTGVLLLVYENTGKDLPIHWQSTVNKWIARDKIWRDIFAKENLVFHPRYLSGGSNWRKPEKVAAALAKARANQSPV